LAGPVLALSSAEGPALVAVVADGRVLGAETAGPEQKAGAFLAPAAARLLSGLGLAPGDLAGVACVTGPGSFTGIRTGLAFALGLARGAGLPLAGLPALPLLAASAAEALGRPGQEIGRAHV